MPEALQQQQAEASSEEMRAQLDSLRGEVERLRVANGELSQKASKRKAEAETLQASLTDAQAQLNTATSEVNRLTVEIPRKQFAEELSPYPDEFLEILSKDFSIDKKDGVLRFLTKAGEHVRDDKGSIIPLEAKAVSDFLSSRGAMGKNVYNALLIGSRATGSGGSPTATHRTQQTKPASPQFGLR
jgi:DNA repair exonuclease SbcCD ATPase subunit